MITSPNELFIQVWLCLCDKRSQYPHTNEVTGETKCSDRKRCKMELAGCVNFFRVFVRMNNAFSYPFLFFVRSGRYCRMRYQ